MLLRLIEDGKPENFQLQIYDLPETMANRIALSVAEQPIFTSDEVGWTTSFNRSHRIHRHRSIRGRGLRWSISRLRSLQNRSAGSRGWNDRPGMWLCRGHNHCLLWRARSLWLRRAYCRHLRYRPWTLSIHRHRYGKILHQSWGLPDSLEGE